MVKQAGEIDMKWTVADDRSSQTSDSGYVVKKSMIRREVGTPSEFPVYHASTPTGGFLGACGERADAESLCEKHQQQKRKAA